MTISLDGFIAGAGDATPWSDDAWSSYATFIKSKGNLIIGRRTFELMEQAGDEFAKIGNPFTIVLSEKRAAPLHGKVLFVKSPDEALAMMRGQGFTEVVLGGGGVTNGGFLKAGLIDELMLDVEPQLLNAGQRLFGPEPAKCVLTLAGTERLGNRLVRLRYRVKK
jgi:dihydrofolate reductase